MSKYAIQLFDGSVERPFAACREPFATAEFSDRASMAAFLDLICDSALVQAFDDRGEWEFSTDGEPVAFLDVAVRLPLHGYVDERALFDAVVAEMGPQA